MKLSRLAVIPALALSAGLCSAQDAQDLAKALANPVSSLVSVPFQANFDRNLGPDDRGDKFTLNIQPVIPFALNDNWNLISRTILPVVDQDNVFGRSGSQTGLGDTVQSLFFSPVEPTSGGWILGAGPVFLIPTATDDLLGADQWGVGPTGVALTQRGPWTVGSLGNHIWSVAGDSDRPDISQTFLQPFVSYNTPTAVSYTINTEATYNWKTKDWTVPIGAFIGKILVVGGQSLQVQAGPRYYAQAPDSGPEGWGARFGVVLMFPK
ncbi:transporter [Marinobacter salinisoli]|uniref:Transporter n=1 Tax=Marinobacter salinisoli TaxID=2769486 RepID=A0ABX7MNY4_9GAMM|nr:transporter [Marinobacter salinisoli]QSP93939.1 transporter [Marinobacter salinisoli]